jgi:hypothetical protein
MKYPLSLALVDYIPVIATLIGQWILITTLGENINPIATMALTGAVLMFSGGFFKATWKTIIAATEKDFRWMEHSLFLLLAPGACLFAWAMWSVQRGMTDQAIINNWLYPLLISIVFIAVSIPRINKSKKWFMPLVGLLTVAMGVIAYNAYLIAELMTNTLAAWLFLISFVISLITAGISRRAASIAVQWVMEIANSISALVFVIAAFLL